MFRTALRNVVAHKARLLMTMLAVMLGVAFVAGTLIFTGSVSDAYTRSSEQSFAHVDVRIRPVDTGESSGRLLDQGLLERAGQLPGVASATGVVSGFAALAGPDGQMVGEGWATVGANHDSANGPAARYPMVEGRAPTAEGEIAIDARTAQRTGFRVGDTVRLSVSGPVVTERVTGIFTTDDGNVAAGGTLTLFDTATAQSLFARPGHYNHIELTAEPATTPESLQQETARVIPGGLEAVTAAQLAQQQANLNASSFSALSQILLACAGLALFVGIFLIANTFTMLVAQRTKELALLRAVGASRRQVTRSVLVEAALVGLAASAAGLAIGAGVGAGVRALLVATGARLPDGPLVVDATTVARLACHRRRRHLPGCLAAGPPRREDPAGRRAEQRARGAHRSQPGGAQRVRRRPRRHRRRLVIAATFMADGRVWLAIGAVLLLTGVFVLTPLLSRPVIAAAGPALRWFGVSGRLAGQNAVRNPRRTAATASALTIGLTLVTALTVIGAGADRATEELAGSDYLRADYIVALANAGPLGPGTERTLREVDGVTATSPAARDPGHRRRRRAGGDRLPDRVDRRAAQPGLHRGRLRPGRHRCRRYRYRRRLWLARGRHRAVTWPDGASGALRLTGLYHSTIDGGVKTDISVTDPHLDRIADHEVYVKTERGRARR